VPAGDERPLDPQPFGAEELSGAFGVHGRSLRP
jgi:hypothetical protein